jgi:transcriptional regulator with XRE-family HTH domain
MADDVLDSYRRALRDYRLALGLELQARREAANYSLSELAVRTGIPIETLRSYEKGLSLPQIIRLANIGTAYAVSALDIMTSTATYIYRASGEPIPDPRLVPADTVALRAVILYCGVTPAQLTLVELPPSQGRPG